MKEELVKVQGIVTEVLPNTSYRVKLDNNAIIFAYAAGKMKIHSIKVIVGDKVDVELSPYDLTKGRVVYRYK